LISGTPFGNLGSEDPVLALTTSFTFGKYVDLRTQL